MVCQLYITGKCEAKRENASVLLVRGAKDEGVEMCTMWCGLVDVNNVNHLRTVFTPYIT